MLKTEILAKLEDFEAGGILVSSVKGERSIDVCQFKLKPKTDDAEEPIYEIRCMFCNVLIGSGDKKFVIEYVNKNWNCLAYYSPKNTNCKVNIGGCLDEEKNI